MATTMKPQTPMYGTSTLPPLGDGLPLKLELREPPPSFAVQPVQDIPTRGRAYLSRQTSTATTLVGDSDCAPCVGSSTATTAVLGDELCRSPIPSPPRLATRSSVFSMRGSVRMQSMDDNYCDRIRSTRAHSAAVRTVPHGHAGKASSTMQSDHLVRSAGTLPIVRHVNHDQLNTSGQAGTGDGNTRTSVYTTTRYEKERNLSAQTSFGWYDESTVFESIDVPQSGCYQIGDWRNLETWDGGRGREPHAEDEEATPEIQFQVPHEHVTTTKTFRNSMHGRPEAYAVAIGGTRVIRVSPYASHAEYQVLISTKDAIFKSWKRFSDFKLLAEYAKISDLRDSVMAWRNIQQTQRWFRCLEANYLKTKCMLLEKFLAQLLFEVPSPALLLTFVGAEQPDFARRKA